MSYSELIFFVMLVTNRELRNPEFIRDVRIFAASLGIPPDQWLEFLYAVYRDFPGCVMHRGREVFLDLEGQFEPPDSVIFGPQAALDQYWNTQNHWFSYQATVPAPFVMPYINGASWERFRVFATILKMVSPGPVRPFGLRPANDDGQANAHQWHANDNRPPPTSRTADQE